MQGQKAVFINFMTMCLFLILLFIITIWHEMLRVSTTLLCSDSALAQINEIWIQDSSVFPLRLSLALALHKSLSRISNMLEDISMWDNLQTEKLTSLNRLHCMSCH